MNNMEAIMKAAGPVEVKTVITFRTPCPIIEIDMGLDPFDGPWERIVLHTVTSTVTSDTVTITGFRLDENNKEIISQDGIVQVQARRNGYRLA